MNYVLSNNSLSLIQIWADPHLGYYPYLPNCNSFWNLSLQSKSEVRRFVEFEFWGSKFDKSQVKKNNLLRFNKSERRISSWIWTWTNFSQNLKWIFKMNFNEIFSQIRAFVVKFRTLGPRLPLHPAHACMFIVSFDHFNCINVFDTM